jgi:hypothetical protein
MKRYFWFSQKQLDGQRQTKASSRQFANFVAIKGVKHQFTESTAGDKPSGAWGDYALVGVAEESKVTHRAAPAI